jgi:dihydroorotase
MVQLTEAGCVGFSQADVALENTQVLATRFAVRQLLWLHGVAASSGTALWEKVWRPAARLLPEWVCRACLWLLKPSRLHTIFELLKSTKAHVHLCRISSAAGVVLVRQAKAEGLPITCDVSINSLHLTDADVGYFDSRARVSPPLRQQRDRDALREALADGTIDALVSDHSPVSEDEKALPFAEAEPGATGLELLLSLALKWSQDSKVPFDAGHCYHYQRSGACAQKRHGPTEGGCSGRCVHLGS